jgi:hypothetical protein
VTELIAQQREMRSITLTQQRELAEVRGQLKALIQMQIAASRKYIIPTQLSTHDKSWTSSDGHVLH